MNPYCPCFLFVDARSTSMVWVVVICECSLAVRFGQTACDLDWLHILDWGNPSFIPDGRNFFSRPEHQSAEFHFGGKLLRSRPNCTLPNWSGHARNRFAETENFIWLARNAAELSTITNSYVESSTSPASRRSAPAG
jgi:hypothetical protein